MTPGPIKRDNEDLNKLITGTLWTLFSQTFEMKVSKGAKIRNRCDQVPHLNQDTIGKVTNSQLHTTNESQEVIPCPAGDHKAKINRRAQRHNKHKIEKNIKNPQKLYCMSQVR